MTQRSPLSFLQTSDEILKPFEPDFLLDRKKLAKQLTTYVDRLRAGAVVGISAPWGEGKSWFGRHWAAMLKEEGHKVAFLDAFESDYLEDPFILIASELGELLEEDTVEAVSFRKKAAVVAKALVPLSTKALVNLAGRILVGSADLSEDISKAAEEATGGVADATETWLEERLSSVQKERASVKAFKAELENAASKSNKPVVVFVDELDRCKPTFAITLIERLKHLFDVPNLIFVLLVNRPQLERAIEGQYGQGTDGSGYLSKFVNIWFDLSKGFKDEENPNSRFDMFVSETLGKYNLDPDIPDINRHKDDLILWASKYNFSLRDIERACALVAMLDGQHTALASYLIAQKVKNGVRFSKLRRFDAEAHLECAAELGSFIASKTVVAEHDYPSNIILAMQEYHKILARVTTLDKCMMLKIHSRDLLGKRSANLNSALTFTANLIDLPIQQI